MKFLARFFGVFAAGAMLIAALPTFVAASTGSIYFTPSSASPGTQVTVDGSGFTHVANNGGLIQLLTSSSVPIVTVPFTVGATGAFENFFTVPQYPRGAYTVFFQDNAADSLSLGATFSIIPGISVGLTSGMPGTLVTVNGGGFTAGNTVNVYFGSLWVASSTALANGTIPPTTFNVPSNIPRTTVNIKANDGNGDSNLSPFTVLPKLNVPSSAVGAGDSISVSGNGFNANDTISFAIDGVSLGITASTDATGTFSSNITVPVLTRGNHNLTATDSNGSATAIITVGTKITVSPITGNTGQSVTVNGTGFDAGTATVFWDNLPQPTTATVASNGTFTLSFTVPGSQGGVYTHTIFAKDTNNNQSQSVTFISTYNATLTPADGSTANGYVGQGYTASGTGFFPTDPVTVKLTSVVAGSASVTVANTTSNATGTFTVTFKIPPATLHGDYTIVVADSHGTSQSFTFTMSSTPPPAPTLSAPADGANATQPITLNWGAVTDPSGVTYTLVLGVNSDLTVILWQKTGLTGTSYTLTAAEKLPVLKHGESYYWKVFATDGASNVGPSSTIQAFTVGNWFTQFMAGLPTWAPYAAIGAVAVLVILLVVLLARRGSGGY